MHYRGTKSLLSNKASIPYGTANASNKHYTAPSIDPRLIDWLDEIYPNTLPLREQTAYEQGQLHGQRFVINKLKSELRKQRAYNTEDSHVLTQTKATQN